MRYFVLALLIFFSVSAALLLLQKPKTIETVREVLKVEQVEKTVEKIVSEVSPQDLLLPDLVIEAPKQLFITGGLERRKLHFDTVFTNRGEGPFEVIGHTDATRQVIFGSQYVQRKDGAGFYREIGNFIFHPGHRHWHVANHVVYEIWSLTEGGSQDKLATTSGKLSICLFDEKPADLSLPGAPKLRTYPSACTSKIQGVSVGWSDIYRANIEGQEINLGKLTDGNYLFRFEVNPDRKILEKDYSNNAGFLKVEIKGNRIKIL